MRPPRERLTREEFELWLSKNRAPIYVTAPYES